MASVRERGSQPQRADRRHLLRHRDGVGIRGPLKKLAVTGMRCGGRAPFHNSDAPKGEGWGEDSQTTLACVFHVEYHPTSQTGTLTEACRGSRCGYDVP